MLAAVVARAVIDLIDDRFHTLENRLTALEHPPREIPAKVV